eukprot:TRINITY_DN1935_c0_g2_i3.p2 TRINITY_DN1935_c0_g2~~TRINITY_DN1935_c0_g2_i3.p2  ORF type:complete len:223 (-),score=35.32 TRINITY_DN1935_c0_g2_i3:532-1200(-)
MVKSHQQGQITATNQQLPFQQMTYDFFHSSNNRRQLLSQFFGITTLFLASQSRATSVVETIKGKSDERDIQILSSGVRYSDLKSGSGDVPKSGDTVMLQLIGSLEDGTVFLDTSEEGVPIVGELGISNKGIPEGLQDVIATMNAGSRRLVIVPASLGLGQETVQMPKANVPGNSVLYYDVELLRCQKLKLGLACCSEDKYPCFAEDPSDELLKEAESQQQQQ